MTTNKNQNTGKGNKVNFGILKDSTHAGVLDTIYRYKDIRDKMFEASVTRDEALSALRKKFKGVITADKKYRTDDKSKQELYNEQSDKIANVYANTCKKLRESLDTDVYRPIIGDIDKLYRGFTEYISGGVKKDYFESVDDVLRKGLLLSGYSDRALRSVSDILIRGVGKQSSGLKAAYYDDRDVKVLSKAKYCELFIGNLRALLQEKHVIDINLRERPKKADNTPTVKDLARDAEQTIRNKEKAGKNKAA